jgi:hypothetical protein
VGVYAVGWPECLTIDLSFNLNTSCISIKQDIFSGLLGALHSGIPIYLEAEVSDLPQVCHSVAIKIITIHVIEVAISITTIITYLHNYI